MRLVKIRNHFIWVGTVGGGINKMIPSSTGFKNLALPKEYIRWNNRNLCYGHAANGK